ncbi:MAG: hypothetical protein ACJAWS_003010 [Oleiphilaceae bacterium]|jgi:hypothetical protein
MSLQENILVARRAVNMALQCSPFGSSNKEQKIDREFGNMVGQVEWYGAPDAFDTQTYIDELNDDQYSGAGKLSEILRWGKAARTLGTGNCGELAALAFTDLYQNGVSSIDYMVFNKKNYDHAWVTIGKAADATSDLSTWGAEAVWCDPWADPNGLVFAIQDLLNGAVLPSTHEFKYAIEAVKNGGSVTTKLLSAGNPESRYRRS